MFRGFFTNLKRLLRFRGNRGRDASRGKLVGVYLNETNQRKGPAANQDRLEGRYSRSRRRG